MGEPVVGSGRRDAFARSRWRMEQSQDEQAIEAGLRERLGEAAELDTSIETLREALILLEARLEEERGRWVAAEAQVAFLAAQVEQHQTTAGLAGRLRRLAGR
jgi:hypothetical protein